MSVNNTIVDRISIAKDYSYLILMELLNGIF
jgi:hypothetical protein